MEIIKPEFFIVGAPKCGTTALYRYLSLHPDIFMPRQKEIHFFGSDLLSPSYIRDAKEYLSFFTDAAPGQVCGEASAWYLYSCNAAHEIKAFNPDAKIIIMLRNPVDMMYSLHSEQLFHGYETISDFRTALAMEDKRREIASENPQGSGQHLLQYKTAARYVEQVRRYMDNFPASQLHIILYDDLNKDFSTIYRRVLEFLAVPDHVIERFDVVNANKRPASKLFNRYIIQSHPLLRQLVRALLPSRSARTRILAALRRINTVKAERPNLDPQLRKELQLAFNDEVRLLGELLNRDLSSWRA